MEEVLHLYNKSLNIFIKSNPVLDIIYSLHFSSNSHSMHLHSVVISLCSSFHGFKSKTFYNLKVSKNKHTPFAETQQMPLWVLYYMGCSGCMMHQGVRRSIELQYNWVYFSRLPPLDKDVQLMHRFKYTDRLIPRQTSSHVTESREMHSNVIFKRAFSCEYWETLVETVAKLTKFAVNYLFWPTINGTQSSKVWKTTKSYWILLAAQWK